MVKLKNKSDIPLPGSKEYAERELELLNFLPEDAKYASKVKNLRDYLSPQAEWLACAKLEYVLLDKTCKFQNLRAEKDHNYTINVTTKDVEDVKKSLENVSGTRISFLEDLLRHDIIAVLENLGENAAAKVCNEKGIDEDIIRRIEHVKNVLHPGTTSYDILDTVRAYLFKSAWTVIRSEMIKTIGKFYTVAKQYEDILQVGRTHLQHTSPVLVGSMFANYAVRLTRSLKMLDNHFNNLKGKISGIVGTGAGVEAAIGEGYSLDFEKEVLSEFDLTPDYAATQVVPKDNLTRIGAELAIAMTILGNWAEDVRTLYSSDIREMYSDDSARKGGSSTDSGKDNPIDYENMAGKVAVVQSSLIIYFAQMMTDLQRDLRSSVQARYVPQIPMAQIYESFIRANTAIEKLAVNKANIEKNLLAVRNSPTEAMNVILKRIDFYHPIMKAGAHEFAKKLAQQVDKRAENALEHFKKIKDYKEFYEALPDADKKILEASLDYKIKPRLIDVALEDEHFKKAYDERLTEKNRRILQGELENYTGTAKDRIRLNFMESNEYLNLSEVAELFK